jgi:hypothetical protein
MALPKNNTSGVPTTDYSGPGAGVKIMQSSDPLAAAEAANEAYRAAQTSGAGSGISPTYYNPTVPTQTAKTPRDLSYSTPGQIAQYMRADGGSLNFGGADPDKYLGPHVESTGQGGRSAALRDRASKLLGIPINPNISDQALITMLTQFNEQTPYGGIGQGTSSMDAIDQLLRIAEGTGIQSFAGGGRVSRPTVALVGENGPELAMLQSGDLILPLPKKQSKKVEKMPSIPKMEHGGMIFGGGPGRMMRGGANQPLMEREYFTGPGFEVSGRTADDPNLREMTAYTVKRQPQGPRPLDWESVGRFLPFSQGLGSGIPDQGSGFNPRAMPGGIGSGSPEFLQYQGGRRLMPFEQQHTGSLLPEQSASTGQEWYTRLREAQGLAPIDDSIKSQTLGQQYTPFEQQQQIDFQEQMARQKGAGTGISEYVIDPLFSGVLPPTPGAAPVAPATPPRVAPTAAQQLQTTGDFGGIKQSDAVQQPITAGRSMEEQFLSPSELRNQPMYKTADASGMDTGAYLDAAFKGELTPAMMNEALSVRADLKNDVDQLASEIQYLQGLDELDDAQKLKLTELRKEWSDATEKYNAVADVITEADEINSAAMTRGQLLEDAARTRAEQLEDEARAQAEKERLEYADEMKQAEQLQIERAGMREQRQYAQQQQQDMANSVRQLFGSLGINLPEGSLAGISPEMMPQILQMLFSMQRQQYAPPTVARFGFA